LAALQKGQPSILLRLLSQGAGAAATWITTGSPIWGWLGVKTIGAFRDAGMKRVDDVLREAMLNPELARALLEKAPRDPDMGSLTRLASVLRKASLMGGSIGVIKSAGQQTDIPAPSAGPAPPVSQNALLGIRPGNQNAFAKAGRP
jgi:hypothetical protein